MSDDGAGASEADLLIRGGRVLDTRAGRLAAADVAVRDGRIARVDAPGAGPPARETLAADGTIVAPGLINAHLHVESSLVTPQEYQRMVLPRGTTTIVCDPHEMANVLGRGAFDFFVDSARAMALDMKIGLSSCIPATALGTSGARLSADDLAGYMDLPEVVGLAEMMDIGGMLGDAPEVLAKLELFRDRYVGGHMPLIDDPDTLARFRALGIRDDHESVSRAEAEAKLRAGLNVLIREGTAARNLDALVGLISARNAGRIAFCTDDRHPNEVRAEGEIDHIVRRAIALYDPADHGPNPAAHAIRVYQAATLWAAENFGLDDRGAVEPGMLADLLLLDDLEGCRPRMVLKAGRPVDAELLAEHPRIDPAAYGAYASVRFAGRTEIDPGDLAKPAPADGGASPVIRIVPGQIVTEYAQAALPVDARGHLFIGSDKISETSLSSKQLARGFRLKIVAQPRGMNYALQVFAINPTEDKTLLSLHHLKVDRDQLRGSVALLCDIPEYKQENRNRRAARFDRWVLEGRKFEFNPEHTYGPIYFAQYTQHNSSLQLTAQFAPVPRSLTAFLEVKKGDAWERIAKSEIDYPSYTAQFKVNGWNRDQEVPYRVVTDILLRDDSYHTFMYTGTVAAEPIDQDRVKALVMSCNFDYGFPDQEVVDNAGKHNADLVMFVGDQFYEPAGGFGVQRDPPEKAYLDYLRKWYQFGWSYRELFRHRPSICLPDDHDVYQGNLFGSGGNKVPDKSGPFDRDWGGYIMPADWVNMVMTTQASHMPDPYNPEPIEQGIHVFYTEWEYGGISFGIVEDRKFKSGPREVLPDWVEERDGFVTSPEDFDMSEHDFPDADLLGDRQIEFLKNWVGSWSSGTEFKALVSATPFHSLQTLPEGNASNGQQPRLQIPEPGEYVEGDELVTDMDSNGWPQSKRNEVLRILRKGFAIHLNGDQHLAAITQYGIDTFRDAGYQFTVPALNNSWPRRWWPPVRKNHKSEPDQPPYTGAYRDGFGHPMYVMAVANPQKTGLEPSVLYDRAPGYGVVTFDKNRREITMECWPRHVDPQLESDGQYPGWPRIVKQLQHYQPDPSFLLPVLDIQASNLPVVRVTNEETGELDHVLRIGVLTYQPKVAAEGSYTVEVIDEQQGKSKKTTGLKAIDAGNEKRVTIKLE